MWDDDTKLCDMAVAQLQIEFVNAVHKRVTYAWTEQFSAWVKTEMTKRLLVEWKQDDFDIAFSDIHNA